MKFGDLSEGYLIIRPSTFGSEPYLFTVKHVGPKYIWLHLPYVEIDLPVNDDMDAYNVRVYSSVFAEIL